MKTNKSLHSPVQAQDIASNPHTVPVWDIAVRVFHWTLVSAFAAAYFSEDALDLHVYAGYLAGALIAFRIVWGFIGSAHARFTDFVRAPAAVIAYLKDIVRGTNRRYLGHNPAGGAMIVMLLIAVLATTFSGVAIYGADQHAGPLAFWLGGVSEQTEHLLEEIHEFLANFTVVLIGLHVLGVIFESRHFRENLVKAMITGRKPAASDKHE